MLRQLCIAVLAIILTANTKSSQDFKTVSLVQCPTALLIRMSAPEKENPSINDLLMYMKQSDENRKIEIKALEEKLSTTLTDLVKTGVKEEIDAAVEPIKTKQDDLATEQSKLALKILEMERKLNSCTNDHGNTRPNTRVSGPGAEPSAHPCPPPCPSPHPSLPCPSNGQEESFLRKVAVQKAKKILGFSDIPPLHLQQAIDEHGLDPNDDEEAKVCAVRDFLYYEMKIPEEKVKNMTVLRTFRPARQPDSSRLYAEFGEESSVVLINSYVRNLQPGSNIDIWIPPSLYMRFRDFDSASYKLRTGPEKVKTKIKYGDSDFILVKKSPTCHSWSQVVPDNLSPYDTNPPSYVNPSGSPPPGRSNRQKKRKTLSPSGPTQRKKSLRSDIDIEVDEEISEQISNVETLDDTQGTKQPSLN